MRYIIGIDPGMNGALAILDTETRKAYLISLTWTGLVGEAPLLNTVRLWNIFQHLGVDLSDSHFVCEDVHVFASDGKRSAAKFMAANAATVNALDAIRVIAYNRKSNMLCYEKPTYWVALSPQKWRAQIRSLVGEKGAIAAEVTKNGSLRWFERLVKKWECQVVSSNSNERTPVFSATPILEKPKIKIDQREAFLIALAFYSFTQEKQNG